MQTDEMIKKIMEYDKEGDSRFLEVGKLLRGFYDSLDGEDGMKSHALAELLKSTGIARRRAYYWIEIDRVFSELDVPTQRLTAIGWTKLGIIAKHVDAVSLEAWLTFAEKNTVEELNALLKDQEPPAHTLRFKLTEKQYAIVAGTLLGNGAYLTAGAGLANRELALMKICRTVHKAWKQGIA